MLKNKRLICSETCHPPKEMRFSENLSLNLYFKKLIGYIEWKVKRSLLQRNNDMVWKRDIFNVNPIAQLQLHFL